MFEKQKNKQVFKSSQNLSCHKPPGSSYVTVLPCDVLVFGPNIIVVSHISKRNQLKQKTPRTPLLIATNELPCCHFESAQ